MIATIGVGDEPSGICYVSATNTIYVANENSGTISVISLDVSSGGVSVGGASIYIAGGTIAVIALAAVFYRRRRAGKK